MNPPRAQAVLKTFGLLLLTAICLTAAFAPLSQFYLAWIGLVPWLMVVASARSTLRAALWGWFGGLLFMSANFWPFGRMAPLGMLAVCMLIALAWAFSAAVLYRCDVLQNLRNATRWKLFRASLATACVWVTAEWLQGRIIFGMAWLYIGHSQTPLLPLCQIADIGSAYAVSFIVVGLNACAFILLSRRSWRDCRIALVGWAIIFFAAMGYGFFRIHQTRTTPGPTVMVVQSDVVYHRNGIASLDQVGHLKLLFDLTTHALEQRDLHDPAIDLIAWPEDISPPLNDEARRELSSAASGAMIRSLYSALHQLADSFSTHILVGGYFVGDFQNVNGTRQGTEFHNAAYLFSGASAVVQRYDKMHLVPLGEYIPRWQWLPWIGDLIAMLSPRPLDFAMTPGRNQDAILHLQFANRTDRTDRTSRFIAPICYDDLFSADIARLATNNSNKIDMIVAITNDGWLVQPALDQRMQQAVFRCIENRLPLARSSNGGPSGFIDSLGRQAGYIQPWSRGVLVQQVQIDSRRTIYQRIGDAWPACCAIVTALLIINTLRRRLILGKPSTKRS